MRPDEFQSQMGRLVAQFGKSQYSDERTKLIWREIKDFSLNWWERTVDHLLLTCRQAPLHAEFGELIGRERERLWKTEKKEHGQDAKDFFQSSYQPEDKKALCQTIIKRLQGNVSEEDYSSFQKMLNNVAASNPNVSQMRKCRQCDDSGFIFHRDQENYEWVYRCTCNSGSSKPKAYPLYQSRQAI
jgi:hypothetical protein